MEESNIISDDSKKFPCPVCSKFFASKHNVKRHISKQHTDYTPAIEPPKKSLNFKCDLCSCGFSHAKSLSFHRRTKHTPNVVIPEKLLKCPLCKNDYRKVEINTHFEKNHDIKLENIQLSFETLEKFNEWKNEMEIEKKTKFIKIGRSRITPDSNKYYYKCHRSGDFKSKSVGKRHLKTTGSKKVNAYCPASIKLIKSKEGRFIAHFQSTHVGHQNDLEHLTLSHEERQLLAAKIKAKIPLDSILDDIRMSVTDSGLERLHLLTKKDLYNIRRSYNLTSDAVDDYLSVDLWVQEMKNSESPCVLFYKSQDMTSEYSFLKREDFILIIMTEAQSEILKKFGANCVCIDRTNEVNGCGFELITLLVLDDMRQGFPCAFMISNRCDQPVLSLFFSHIKQKIGGLSPSVFMSDTAEAFFNAWVEQMGMSEMPLFCAWDSVLNTNVHIKRMHKTLKYIYLNKKNIKRLDKALHAIMGFVRDKMIDRVILVNKGKLTSKLRDIQKRHETSLQLTLQITKNDKKWRIGSAKNNETYDVEKIKDNCSCQIVCEECHACIHQYICSCVDSSIKWNMCKHIHYLCMQIKPSVPNVDQNNDSSDIPSPETISFNDDSVPDVFSVEISQTTQTHNSLEERKKSLINTYTNIINSLSSPEQCSIMETNAKSLVATLNSVSCVDTLPQTSHKYCPANQIIVPQQMFQPTKKVKLNTLQGTGTLWLIPVTQL